MRARRHRQAALASEPIAPPIFGNLDVPPAVTTDCSVLHGWVVGNELPVVAVRVIVDGATRSTRFGIERPDVAAVHGERDDVRFSGFETYVDLRGREGRSVDVEAEAILSDGSFVHLGRTSVHCVPLTVSRIHGVDRDVPFGAGYLAFNGIALMDEDVARVVIELDGRPVGHARLNAFGTPDLARVSTPSSSMAAFDVIVDIRSCESGTTHVVTSIPHGVSGAVGERSSTEFSIVAEPWGELEEAVLATSLPRLEPRADAGAPIRVFVSTHHLGIGGAQLYLQELLRQLQSAGSFEFCVISDTEGLLRAELEAMGMQVTVVGHAPFNDPVAYEAHIRKIWDLVDDFSPDVVISNTLQCFPAIDVATRCGVPSLFVIHESFPLDEWFVAARGNFAFHPHVRNAAKRAIAHADNLVFEASATRSMFSGLIDDDRSLLIRYGIETEPLVEYSRAADPMELRASLSIGPDDVVFLCVGVYEPRKAQSMLASAFSDVLTEFPNAVLLLIGAQNDPYSEAVKRHVDKLGCGERIRVLPIVRDLRPWYAISDVLVSASDIESMPRSMMEAMAFGLPVLAASASGVDELVAEGQSGWLVPTRDLVALRDGLRRAIDSGIDGRRTLGEHARRKVIDDHQSSGYGAAFAGLIESVAQR